MRTCPRTVICAARQLGADLVDGLLHLFGDGAQVAALHGGVDVHHRRDVVVRHHLRLHGGAHLHQVAEQLRAAGLRGAAARAGHRRAQQGIERIDAVLRTLHRHLVDHAVDRVQPERGRGLEAGAERHQQVLRHVAPLQADLLDAGAVHVDGQRGLVEALVHVRIHRAGDPPDAVGEDAGQLLVGRHVGARELHVDGRRQPEVEDLADDVRRLEGELHAGEALGQFFAQAAHVFRAGLALAFAQRDQDLAVERADGAGVAVRQVDAGVGHAQVVEERGQLVAGMMVRMAASTSSARRAVSSMRRPNGARMCRRIWPASTSGKKSRPSAR